MPTIYCPDLRGIGVSSQGAAYHSYTVSVPPFPMVRQSHEELGRSLWVELHAHTNPTKKWFTNWLARVPNTSLCGSCQKWAIDWIDIPGNEPNYDNWLPWSVRFHNAVNAKLGREQWTIDEAAARWSGSFAE